MMLGKFKVVAATIVAVAASVMMMAPADAGKKAPQEPKATAPSPNSIKLEPSAWIAKVDGLPGQWTYVVSPDPSGRHAAAHGTIDVGFSVTALFGPVVGERAFFAGSQVEYPEFLDPGPPGDKRHPGPIRRDLRHEILAAGRPPASTDGTASTVIASATTSCIT